MTSPGTGRRHAGRVFFAAWLATLIFAFVFDDRIMSWIVAAAAGLPSPLIAALSWSPAGLAIVVLALANLSLGKNPVRAGWVVILAVLGLAATLQFPVAFNRRASDFYHSLAATPEGSAFIAGAWWAYGPMIGAALLLMTARWVVNRFNGKKTRFVDRQWGTDPRTRRWVSGFVAAAACLGLIAALRHG